MNTLRWKHWFHAALILLAPVTQAHAMGSAPPWQEEFGDRECNLQTTGRNEYFVLEPGFQLVLEGGGAKLQITVLDETKTVDGVQYPGGRGARVEDGRLNEVSRNYFAICEQTKDVFYFGEDVEYLQERQGRQARRRVARRRERREGRPDHARSAEARRCATTRRSRPASPWTARRSSASPKPARRRRARSPDA